MNYIIEKKGNENMRLAVFEQIAREFTKKDREYILKKMQERKQTLYKKFNKFDEKKDPYQRSLAKDRYNAYVLYIENTKNKLFNFNLK